MCDYSNSCVYAIVCKNENIQDMYVGSTSNFEQRKCDHKKDCNNSNRKSYNLKVYKFIRDNGEFDNFKFEILEEVCCENKQELIKRERFYVESLEPSLNIQVPSRSKKEYREQHHDKITEKINCECGGRYTRQHKAKHFKSKKHQHYIKNLNIN